MITIRGQQSQNLAVASHLPDQDIQKKAGETDWLSQGATIKMTNKAASHIGDEQQRAAGRERWRNYDNNLIGIILNAAVSHLYGLADCLRGAENAIWKREN